MSKILDGTKLSQKILNNLKRQVSKKQLKLAVVLIGDNLVSQVYIQKKKKACEEIGIDFVFFKFSSRIKESKFRKELEKIDKDPNISGIIVQLPLPKEFNTQEILNIVSSQKDVDVLSEKNMSEFLGGTLPILPPVVAGIKYLLEEYDISLKGKEIVLVGDGKLVGRPLSVWLSHQDLDYSVLDKSVENISKFTEKADVIISGTGVANLIQNSIVKKGAILIDAGSSSEGGKTIGDISIDAYSKASFVSPVPGGLGPVTVACLLENLIKLNSK